MTQADRVLSTPPTNTPIDTTRRRFLAVAAVGSIIGAGSLAVAAAMPPDVPQAVTVPQASPELRAAIRQLSATHATLVRAEADLEEVEAIVTDWLAKHPKPTSKRGIRRWIKKTDNYHRATTATVWQAVLTAEQAFEHDQHAVAAVPISGPGDVAALAAASIIFDAVELHTNNRAPIARAVVAQVFKLGKTVLS
jgi:hypothetical protein